MQVKLLCGYLFFSWLVFLMILFVIPISVDAENPEGDSLQKKIEDAKAGDIISLSSGVYNGPIIINKPLKLQGEKGTIIKGDNDGNVLTINGTQNVVIENVKIEGSGKKSNNAGIFIKESKNIKIENVTIRANMHGIYSNSVGDSSFVNNTITGTSAHFSKKGNGIYLYKTEGISLINNKITSVQDGLYIEEDKGSIVTDNTISKSRYGMHFMYSKDGKVIGNKIRDNITGIMVMVTDGMTISKNKMEDHIHYQGAGIILYNVTATNVTNNESRNNSVGVSLQSSEGISLLANRIVNNQIGIALLNNSDRNEVSLNTFSGNIMQVKSDKTKSILSKDAQGNYWDDYDGLDVNGDGIGDTPYIPTNTYAHLVSTQPVFQYFFESPATVLMNQFDQQLISGDEQRVRDNAPLMGATQWHWDGFSPSYSTISSGIVLIGIGFIIRRKVGM